MLGTKRPSHALVKKAEELLAAEHPDATKLSQLQNTHTVADFSKELSVLYNTIDAIGQKGEVKITQWIRGSALSWTDSYNKPHPMEIHQGILKVGGISLESAM